MKELEYLLKQLERTPNRPLTYGYLVESIKLALLDMEDDEENQERERISNYDDLDHH